MDSRRDTRMDAAKNGSRRILQATRINRIHPVAPGPRRRWPLIMSTPLPGSARVTDALLTERKGAVARLRLHRPELHNAFDAALITALTAALEQLAGDDDVRVVVLARRRKRLKSSHKCASRMP